MTAGGGGFVDPGASGARRADVVSARDFNLSDMRVVVARIEGTVQMMFLADGWQGGPRKVLSNMFCDAATPGQLRALADHLDSLPLEPALSSCALSRTEA